MPAPRRRFFPAALLLVLLAGFGVGLARLLELRLSGGDVYPPYSTLRADALGTKALHDALAELPDLRVERGYRPWRRQFAPRFAVGGRPAPEQGITPLSETTLFLVGLDPARWPYLFDREELDVLEDLTRRGLRVVLTFQPLRNVPTTQGLRRQRETEEERVKKAREADDTRDRRRRGESGGNKPDPATKKGSAGDGNKPDPPG